MYRNWKKICKEGDQNLRLLLATTNDKRVLEGLAKGFPEFFCEKEQELCVPVSAILNWRDPNSESGITLPEAALEHFGVPFFTFGPFAEEGYPPGFSEKFDGKDFAINGEAGDSAFEVHYFKWQGNRCIVADCSPGDRAILVPEAFIDLNA